MQPTLTDIEIAHILAAYHRIADQRDDKRVALAIIAATILLAIAASALAFIIWTLWEAFSNPALWGPEVL